MDAKDWFVIVLLALGWAASTVFIFLHPEIANFVTWSTFSGAVLSAYHWLVIKDSKTADAP